MAQEKKSFVLYFDYREHLALLDDVERGRLLMALLDYGEFGTVPALEGAARMAFSFIRAQMDRDAGKWEQVRQAKIEAGRQGGLKSGQSRRAGASTAKQDEADEAYASFASSDEADGSKRSVTVTVTDNVNVTGTDTVTDTVIEIPPPAPSGGKQEPVPFEKIMQLYNETCKSFPKIMNIDGQRRKAVAARWKTYKTLETFELLFKKTEASDFMKGDNDRNWSADFDWIMRPTNFTKVLEGRYDSDKPKGGTQYGTGADQQHTEQNSRKSFNFDGWHIAKDDEE